jgi:hypothetical protein
VRRTLDFSGDRTLLKARLVELRVEGLAEERCEANLTADLSNQRGEYLSLAGPRVQVRLQQGFPGAETRPR